MAGHARERTPGKWELRVYDPTAGKYRTRTVTALATGKAAKAPARLPLAKVCDEWISGRSYRSRHTAQNDRWALSHIKPSPLGKQPIRGIGLHDLQQFIRSLEVHLAANSVRD